MKSAGLGGRLSRECGATLVFVGLSLLALLSIMALAIDLGMLYVARGEAQRAADAAALAGANVFNTSGCATISTCDTPPFESEAAKNAVATASQNLVAGAPPQIDCGSDYTGVSCPGNTPGIQFTFPTSTEPQITVTLHRTKIPTIFAKMFGVFSGNVSASATAEAYLGTGSNYCPTPFLVPNCDPNPKNVAPYSSVAANPSCQGNLAPFISGSGSSETVANPQIYTGTAPGVYGQPWTLHYAYNATPGPAGSVVASQWSMAAFPTSSGTFPNGTNALVNYIRECPAVPIACGDSVGINPGNSPVPINKAINERIYYGYADNPSGLGNGQDAIDTTPAGTTAAGCTAPAFPVTMGSWWSKYTGKNASSPFCGAPSSSHSVVWAPVYDGNQLSPGCSGSQSTNCTVTVIGFMQLFLRSSYVASGTETVQTVILNVEPCNNSGNISTVGATIPIRLIQKAN